MGFFKSIAKRRVDRQRKKRATDLYKRRDIKLDTAIASGKVTPKQKKALGKGGTKKYRKKFGPKVGIAKAVEKKGTVSDILKDIRGG